MKYNFLIIFTFIISICSAQSGGQTGKIKGIVRDAKSGEVLPNIEVYILGTQVFTLSNSQGEYSFDNAPVGYQKLLFRSIGYVDFISEPIQITVAQQRSLDADITPSETAIEEVQIVGRNTRRIETPPVGIYKLNIQEIEKAPGGNRDISKVVQNLPGVVATPINRNDLIVRGGGPNENKFYLDRIEIPVINHFQTQGASGGTNSLVNTDFLSSATLYSSAFPASRGNALSSVLDLKMIEGNSDKFKTKFSVGASDLSLTFDTPINQKSNLIASYRISYLQFLFKALKLPFLPTYQDMQMKYSYHINDRNSISVIGLGSFDKNRLNLSMKDLEPDRQQILNFLPESDQWSYMVGAVYSHITDNGSLNAILSTNRLFNGHQKWQDNNTSLPKTIDYKSNESEIKARLEYNTALGKGYSLNTGVSAERGFYDSHDLQKKFIGGIPVDDKYDTELNITRYSAYAAIDRAFFSGKLQLNLSARVDGNNYSSEMSNPFSQFSPRFAASYRINPKWSLNGNVGRYYQEPGYTTLGFRNQVGALVNKDRLKYMVSDQITAGFAFVPRSGERFSIEGFYKDYANYPMSLTDSTAIGSNGNNFGAIGAEDVSSIGKARAYGVEVMYRNDNLWGFLFNVSYTLYLSEYKGLDKNFQPTGGYIPSNWDNRHLFNIVASRSFAKGWDVGMRWRYAGGAPTTPYDSQKSAMIDSWETNRQPVLDYSKVNTMRVPAFHQLDLRVDRTWYFKKWTLSLYIDIQNVYNYKAYGKDLLMPQTDSDGKFIVDPQNPKQYLMRTYPNELGGTIIPSFGIIIEI